MAQPIIEGTVDLAVEVGVLPWPARIMIAYLSRAPDERAAGKLDGDAASTG
jgi:hypothetical protein